MAEGLDSKQLLDRYFAAVYSYVAYRVAPDREAACDITQNVFLAVCKSAESLQRDGSALAWLRAIARSKVADHFRTSAARGNEILTAFELLADLPAVNSELAENERQLRALRLSLAMRALPDNYAEMLEEKYLEGFSIRTMAKRHRQSEKAVESVLARAREAFRAAWEHVAEVDLESDLGNNERSPTHERQ